MASMKIDIKDVAIAYAAFVIAPVPTLFGLMSGCGPDGVVISGSGGSDGGVDETDTTPAAADSGVQPADSGELETDAETDAGTDVSSIEHDRVSDGVLVEKGSISAMSHLIATPSSNAQSLGSLWTIGEKAQSFTLNKGEVKAGQSTRFQQVAEVEKGAFAIGGDMKATALIPFYNPGDGQAEGVFAMIACNADALAAAKAAGSVASGTARQCALAVFNLNESGNERVRIDTIPAVQFEGGARTVSVIGSAFKIADKILYSAMLDGTSAGNIITTERAGLYFNAQPNKYCVSASTGGGFPSAMAALPGGGFGVLNTSGGSAGNAKLARFAALPTCDGSVKMPLEDSIDLGAREVAPTNIIPIAAGVQPLALALPLEGGLSLIDLNAGRSYQITLSDQIVGAAFAAGGNGTSDIYAVTNGKDMLKLSFSIIDGVLVSADPQKICLGVPGREITSMGANAIFSLAGDAGNYLASIDDVAQVVPTECR